MYNIDNVFTQIRILLSLNNLRLVSTIKKIIEHNIFEGMTYWFYILLFDFVPIPFKINFFFVNLNMVLRQGGYNCIILAFQKKKN